MNGAVLGARTNEQLDDNLAVATFELTAEQMARLDDVSKPDLGYPHSHLGSPTISKFLYGGANIKY